MVGLRGAPGATVRPKPQTSGGRIRALGSARTCSRGLNGAVGGATGATLCPPSLHHPGRLRGATGATVSPTTLVEVGLIHDTDTPVKILGQGTLAKKLNVTAKKFSTGAREKIESAGGSCTEA